MSPGGIQRWYRPPSLGDAHAPLLVVEASAGTGKTWFLERRVVDLVLRAGATIDQILVVTFTEKATAELRSRVRGQLSRMVHGQPDGPPLAPSPSTPPHGVAQDRLESKGPSSRFRSAPVWRC